MTRRSIPGQVELKGKLAEHHMLDRAFAMLEAAKSSFYKDHILLYEAVMGTGPKPTEKTIEALDRWSLFMHWGKYERERIEAVEDRVIEGIEKRGGGLSL